MNRMKVFAIALVAALVSVSCASHKGSSSLGASSKKTTTTASPKVKSDEQLAAEKAAAEAKAEKERRAAEAAAKQAKAEEEAKAREAEEAAQKAMAEAQAKAAQREAEIAAAAKAREEKVKVVETKSKTNGKYHVIIGSFKSLDNARALSNNAISQGYTPSIMENDEGLYRVAVFNAEDESSARKKLAQIKMKYVQYSDAWLLIQK